MEANWKELKKEFFDTGYVVLDGWIEPELVERTKQDAHQYGAIDIFERESIGDLLCHAKVVEFIAFLLETPEVAISPFRFWNHLTQGGQSDGGGWHVDDTYMTDRPLTEILCMYYPQDVEEDMGPTMLLPGSHRRLYTPPQTAKLGWIRGQQKVVAKAGALAVTFASILHARAAHLSAKPRSMIKYGLRGGRPPIRLLPDRASLPQLPPHRAGPLADATSRSQGQGRRAVELLLEIAPELYLFKDFKHQIGVVGRRLRKHLDHEQVS